jgi:phage shock protein A
MENMSIGASQSILLILATYTLTEIKKIMATLEEIKATESQQNLKLNQLTTDLADVSRKVDVLILQGHTGGEGLDQVAMNQIAELQAQVNAQIAAAADSLQAMEDKVDANLGPHPEPVR